MVKRPKTKDRRRGSSEDCLHIQACQRATHHFSTDVEEDSRLVPFLLVFLALGSMGLVGCQTTERNEPVYTIPSAESVAPTSTETATIYSVVSPTPTPEEPDRGLFATFMVPIEHATESRRAQESSLNPEKYKRQVDPALAALGTSWLLVVCGLDHEPPAVEKILICTNSIFVLRHDGSIDTISFTHDTRFPVQEREEGILGKAGSARRSDALWLRRKSDADGLRVLREGYRNATGLPMDFVIVIQSDVAVKDFVDNVVGVIRVDVPKGFTAQPIYIDDMTKISMREYRSGMQEMDGTAVLQYIKAVDGSPAYSPQLENNNRKHTIIQAIVNSIDHQKFNPFYWPTFIYNLNEFVQRQVRSNNVVADFDINHLIIENFGTLGDGVKQIVVHGRSLHSGIPRFGNARYYADATVSGYAQSPIQWGSLNNGDSFAKRDIAELGIYSEYYVEVPRNGNAMDPDIINGYWGPVRVDVKRLLLGPPTVRKSFIEMEMQ